MRARFPVFTAFLLLFVFQPGAVSQTEPRCGFVDVGGKLHPAGKTEDRRFSLESGAWTAASVSLENTWHLFDENPGRKACFYSPDRKVLTEIEGENVALVVDGERIATEFGKLPNAELGWSPDSKRFFVTWTDGGEEGQWRVGIYEIKDGALDSVSAEPTGEDSDLTEAARVDFEAFIRGLPIDPELNSPEYRALWKEAEYCEPTNVVASRWLNNGNELLTSVLVTPVVARCRYGTEFRVYRIDIPSGKVLERYTPAEAYGMFGEEYLPADDGEDREPRPDACEKRSDRRFAVCRGAWSGNTIALFNTWMSPDTNPGRKLRVVSPDGEKAIVVNGFHVRLEINDRKLWAPFGNMHDAEVQWAPDSTRLFVTWSENGQLGPWHTQVYGVSDEGLEEIAGVTRRVRGDLVSRMKRAPLPTWVATKEYRDMWSSLDYCADDVVGLQWLNGPDEILVAGLAGPDSGCKYMGDFVVYRIAVKTGKILQAYSEREAQRVFGDGSLPQIGADDDEL